MVLYRQPHPMNEPAPALLPAPNFCSNGPPPQLPPHYIYPVHQQYSPVGYYPPPRYATVQIGVRVSFALVHHPPAPEHHQVQRYYENQYGTHLPADFNPTNIITSQVLHRSDESREEPHHHHHHHTETHSVPNRYARRQSHNTSHRSSDTTTKAQRGSVRQSGRPHNESSPEKERVLLSQEASTGVEKG